jgi:hypothetical protein
MRDASSHENGVAPREVGVVDRPHVLVDETDLPLARQIRCHEQQSLRRHERTYAGRELVGVLERPERRGVAGECAEDPT